MNKFRLFCSTVQPQQQRRTTTQALQCKAASKHYRIYSRSKSQSARDSLTVDSVQKFIIKSTPGILTKKIFSAFFQKFGTKFK